MSDMCRVAANQVRLIEGLLQDDVAGDFLEELNNNFLVTRQSRQNDVRYEKIRCRGSIIFGTKTGHNFACQFILKDQGLPPHHTGAMISTADASTRPDPRHAAPRHAQWVREMCNASGAREPTAARVLRHRPGAPASRDAKPCRRRRCRGVQPAKRGGGGRGGQCGGAG